MIRLSQRAWNNVIIVSMLILIMLFNFSSHFLNNGINEVLNLSSLVPANTTITIMEFDREKVERIGQGWRTISGVYSNERIASLVERWGNAEVSLFEQGPNWQSPSPSSTVKLWFAGQVLPTEYQFIQLVDKTLVKIDKKMYHLISPSYQMLTISE